MTLMSSSVVGATHIVRCYLSEIDDGADNVHISLNHAKRRQGNDDCEAYLVQLEWYKTTRETAKDRRRDNTLVTPWTVDTTALTSANRRDPD